MKSKQPNEGVGGFKVCRVCEKSKPLELFNFRKDSKKYRNECEQCRGAYTCANRYKVTVGFIEQLRETQGNSCGICGIHAEAIPHSSFKYSPLVIDHDHITGKVRGLLCPTCNCMLGHSKDNINTLANAISYLQKH